MKLDPRIIEGKKPLTPFDTEEAKQFIGKECLFAHEITAFSCLPSLSKGVLTCIDNESKPFKSYFLDGTGKVLSADFIIPSEWVKNTRPLTMNELLKLWEVGKTYRLKKSNHNMITTSSDCIDKMFYGYSQTVAGNFVQLSMAPNETKNPLISSISLEQLSEYEFLIDNGKDKYEWKKLCVKL